MTADEFRKLLNEMYNLSTWPAELEVEADTYANVCQSIFENCSSKGKVRIYVGPHCGIMFKNIELILKEK